MNGFGVGNSTAALSVNSVDAQVIRKFTILNIENGDEFLFVLFIITFIERGNVSGHTVPNDSNASKAEMYRALSTSVCQQLIHRPIT